jgi:tRNA(Ile)-lysidine synthase
MNTIRKVKKYIIDNELVESGEDILVGVSGGPDSVVLLDLLYKLRAEFGLKLIVAHFNHKIREESNKDKQFVAGLASKFDLEFRSGFAKEKISSEQEAREARLSFFRSLMNKQNIKYLALAQNKVDLVETQLFNLIRGSGPKGLIGIEPKRKFGEGQYVIRPLLSLSRKEIISYQQEKKLNFVVDDTNLGLNYSRNKIRHQLLPTLEDINPNIIDNLSNQSEIYSLIDDHLSNLANRFLAGSKKTDFEIGFNQKDFLKLDKIIQLQVLRTATSQLADLKDFSFIHSKEILKIFSQVSSEEKIKKFKGLKFVKEAGRIRIEKLKNN